MRWLAKLAASFVGVALLSAGGCAGTGDHRELLAAARAEYDVGHYAKADSQVTPICDVRRSELAPEALYLRGLSRVGLGRSVGTIAHGDAWFEHARSDLESAAKLAGGRSDPALSRMSHAGLGHLAFNRAHADYARAAWHLRQALPPEQSWEDHPEVEELLFYLGVAEQRAGNWTAGADKLRTLVKRYPKGQYTASAQRQLAESAFTLQVGAFAAMSNAAVQQNWLLRSGLPAMVEPRVNPAGTLHVVRVGRFRTYDEALAVLPRVKSVLAANPSSRTSQVLVLP